MKDGTAAIYGARASDGVILVTTKSGKRNQKTSVAFDAYYSIKTPALLRKPANLLQHAEMALEITDGSFTPEYTRDQLELIRYCPMRNGGVGPVIRNSSRIKTGMICLLAMVICRITMSISPAVERDTRICCL